MKMNPQAGRRARLLLLAVLALGVGCARPSYQNLKLAAPLLPPGGTLRAQSILIRNVLDERDRDAQIMPEAPARRSMRVPGREIGEVPASTSLPDGRLTLMPGQTVEDLVRQTLSNVCESLGYHIETDPGNLSSGDIVIDAKIQKFWAWTAARGLTMPGSDKSFLNGSIATTLELTGPLKKKSTLEIASDYRRGIVLLVTPDQMKEVYKTLLEDYASNAKNNLGNLPQP